MMATINNAFAYLANQSDFIDLMPIEEIDIPDNKRWLIKYESYKGMRFIQVDNNKIIALFKEKSRKNRALDLNILRNEK